VGSRSRTPVGSWDAFEAELNRVLDATSIPFPKDDPPGIFFSVADNELRPLAMLQIAYLAGDFEQIKETDRKFWANPVYRLVTASYALPAAVSAGDFGFYRELETWVKSLLQPSTPPSVRAYIEFTLASVPLGIRSVSEVPEWIKTGNFGNLHQRERVEAVKHRATYFEDIRDFHAMLILAQTAQTLHSVVTGEEHTSLTEIGLLIRVALANLYLGKHDEAVAAALAAMQLAFPHGYVVPFAEVASSGGLFAELIKTHYPHLLDTYLAEADRIQKNWFSLVVQQSQPIFTADVQRLSLAELQIAFGVCLGKTYADIANELHLSEGTVRNKVRAVYDKLGITSGRPRSELQKALWGDQRGEAEP